MLSLFAHARQELANDMAARPKYWACIEDSAAGRQFTLELEACGDPNRDGYSACKELAKIKLDRACDFGEVYKTKEWKPQFGWRTFCGWCIGEEVSTFVNSSHRTTIAEK